MRCTKLHEDSQSSEACLHATDAIIKTLFNLNAMRIRELAELTELELAVGV